MFIRININFVNIAKGGRMQKKLILFLGLLFIFFGGVSYCAEEQITLTTFYPAPYGVYSVLRFFPRTQPATSNEGDVYYDLTGRILRYYDGSAWVDIGEPRGTIILWSGSVANIPSGWALCDGLTHSGITTPNLMDRFVVGAGSSYPVNGTGGSASITLGLNELPSHTHTQATGSTNSAGDHTHGYNDKSHSTNTNDINGAGFFGMVRSLSDVDTSRTTLSTGAHSHSVNVTLNNAGSGQAFDSRPPYYALCYIMKL